MKSKATESLKQGNYNHLVPKLRDAHCSGAGGCRSGRHSRVQLGASLYFLLSISFWGKQFEQSKRKPTVCCIDRSTSASPHLGSKLPVYLGSHTELDGELALWLFFVVRLLDSYQGRGKHLSPSTVNNRKSRLLLEISVSSHRTIAPESAFQRKCLLPP